MMNGGSEKGLGVLNTVVSTQAMLSVCLVTDFNFSLLLNTKAETYLTQFSTQWRSLISMVHTNRAQLGF